MGKRDPRIDEWIEKKSDWKPELKALRRVLLESELDETVKWGSPTYVLQDKNVIGLNAFKHHVAIWFHNGVFLSDDLDVLINANPDNTRGLRQWRFEKNKTIPIDDVRKYVGEEIANQKKGKFIKTVKKATVKTPEELQIKLQNSPKGQEKWKDLSESKRQEYNRYIGGAKKAETRDRRAQKAITLIEKGQGLNDKYKPSS